MLWWQIGHRNRNQSDEIETIGAISVWQKQLHGSRSLMRDGQANANLILISYLSLIGIR